MTVYLARSFHTVLNSTVSRARRRKARCVHCGTDKQKPPCHAVDAETIWTPRLNAIEHRQSGRGAVPRFADRTAGRQTVTSATGRLEEATLTRAALATTFDQARPFVVPGAFRRAAVVVGDLLGAVALVLCIPFVILAIGIPIALCVRVLLWIGGLL